MIKVFGILLISISTLFLIAALIIGKILYKREKKLNYSFLNMFPEELVIKNSSKFYYSIFFQLFFFAEVLIGLFICLPLTQNTLVSAKMGSILYLLSALHIIGMVSVYILIFVFPIDSNYKVHLALFIIFSVTTITKIILFGYFFLSISTTEETSLFVIGIIMMSLAFIGLISIFNPKLIHWYKLQKEIYDDGVIGYIRPRFFSLAYSEWIFILINYLSSIVLLIGFIIFF